ncbi:MAG: hypothetical protein COA37_20860 [Hoeflea sp.]|nr:MAG: hypothetical protein COA37_20860 [Hoeflea sp.]
MTIGSGMQHEPAQPLNYGVDIHSCPIIVTGLQNVPIRLGGQIELSAVGAFFLENDTNNSNTGRN